MRYWKNGLLSNGFAVFVHFFIGEAGPRHLSRFIDVLVGDVMYCLFFGIPVSVVSETNTSGDDCLPSCGGLFASNFPSSSDLSSPENTEFSIFLQFSARLSYDQPNYFKIITYLQSC